MAGLNLMGALNAYQEGKQWHRENEANNDVLAANQAGGEAVQAAHQANIDQAKQAWAQAGNDPSAFQAPTEPDEAAIVAGMNARGDALAAKGRWDEFTKNEAQAIPVRNRLRQRVIGKALADYDATGDGMALAKAAYPTIHNGVNIVGGGLDTTGGQGFAGASQQVEQARQQWAAQGNDPAKFVPPAADTTSNGGQYVVHLSDGRTINMSGQAMRDMAVNAMANPEETAKYEFESRLRSAETAAKIRQAIAEQQAKGQEARSTAGVVHGFRANEIGLTNQGQLAVAGERNKGLLGAAGIRAGATEYAADQTSGARRYAADQSSGARRYAADKGATTRDPATKRMTSVQLMDQARQMFGESKPGAFGSANSANMDTGAIAARADAIRRADPTIPDANALLQAGKEYGFRATKRPTIPGLNSGASAPAGAASGPTITRWGDSPLPTGAPGLTLTGDAGDGTDDEEDANT